MPGWPGWLAGLPVGTLIKFDCALSAPLKRAARSAQRAGSQAASQRACLRAGAFVDPPEQQSPIAVKIHVTSGYAPLRYGGPRKGRTWLHGGIVVHEPGGHRDRFRSGTRVPPPSEVS